MYVLFYMNFFGSDLDLTEIKKRSAHTVIKNHVNNANMHKYVIYHRKCIMRVLM